MNDLLIVDIRYLFMEICIKVSNGYVMTGIYQVYNLLICKVTMNTYICLVFK
jgi:hypothetical protein